MLRSDDLNRAERIHLDNQFCKGNKLVQSMHNTFFLPFFLGCCCRFGRKQIILVIDSRLQGSEDPKSAG